VCDVVATCSASGVHEGRRLVRVLLVMMALLVFCLHRLAEADAGVGVLVCVCVCACVRVCACVCVCMHLFMN